MQPQRTCVGCRGKGDRSRLLRVVAGFASAVVDVVPDPSATAAGRGAWLHPDPACLELAVRRRAFARALRVQGAIDHLEVQRHLAAAVAARSDRAALSQPSSIESGSDSDGHPMSSQQ